MLNLLLNRLDISAQRQKRMDCEYEHVTFISSSPQFYLDVLILRSSGQPFPIQKLYGI